MIISIISYFNWLWQIFNAFLACQYATLFLSFSIKLINYLNIHFYLTILLYIKYTYLVYLIAELILYYHLWFLFYCILNIFTCNGVDFYNLLFWWPSWSSVQRSGVVFCCLVIWHLLLLLNLFSFALLSLVSFLCCRCCYSYFCLFIYSAIVCRPSW